MTVLNMEVDFSKKWLVMAAVAMGVFLATIDGSIVNLALPTLVSVFNTEFAIVQWVVLAYLLTVSTLMLSIGRIADMVGKKNLYMLGFVIFTIGSFLCGFSPSIYALIGFRVLQAIGAAMVMSLGMAIVTEAFPPAERGMALGISGSIVSIGIVVGPTLGGILINSLSWNWIFFVNVPIGILGTFMVIRFVPAIKHTGGQRFDVPGAITLFLGLLSFLFALTTGQRNGFDNWQVLVLSTFSLLLVLTFIYIELHSAHPMVDLRLFRNKQFSGSLMTGVITFIAISGTIFLMPFYLENVLGYDTRQVGLLLAVVPIVLGLVSPLSGVLSDKYGTRFISAIGLGILVFGYLALTTLETHTTSVGFVLRFLAVGVGMGVFQSPNNSSIMGTASRERLGIVSGILAVTRSLGQTTGIAMIATIWAGKVASTSGVYASTNVTNAPPEIQVTALQQTFTIVAILVSIAWIIGLWMLINERRGNKVKAMEASG